MRAAIWTGIDEDFTIEDVGLAQLGPQQVRVEVGASGVCHSDLHAKQGNLLIPPPAVLGHEGVGRVSEVGSEVSDFAKGDRVLSFFAPSCGFCFFCVRGEGHLCERAVEVMVNQNVVRGETPIMAMVGLGTFAEEMNAHRFSLVKVETDIPDGQLALLGCGVTTGVGAVFNTAGVEPGSTVAVIGCGGVGTAVMQGARIAGASRIIAIDMVPAKLEAAAQFGATDTVNAGETNPVDQVRAMTAGRGVDYAFEVIGTVATTRQAYEMARRGGAAVLVGVAKPDVLLDLPLFGMFFDEKRILGCYAGSAQFRRDIPILIDLVETGRLDLEAMVSNQCSLDEINDAFAKMESGEVIRSVIV